MPAQYSHHILSKHPQTLEETSSNMDKGEKLPLSVCLVELLEEQDGPLCQRDITDLSKKACVPSLTASVLILDSHCIFE